MTEHAKLMELFPDNFLSAIGQLSIDIRRVPVRAAHGAYLSKQPGQSLEFRDYQGYTPGDDLRRVDWNTYARTRHLFVRRFERPTAVPIYLFVDASDSMLLETPSRYQTAAKVAAAFASAATSDANPLYLQIADGGSASQSRAATGRPGLVRALSDLARTPAQNGPHLIDSLGSLLPLWASKGRGVLILISDFFASEGAEALVAQLRLMQHQLVLVRITQPSDASPASDAEELQLKDCESSSSLRVSIDKSAIDLYRQAYESYFSTLDQFAASHGALQATIDATGDTLTQLEKLFPGGVLKI